ncbi:MAG: PQQ-dependent sugar dehydrogenase [Pseudomonadota bacterium]
MYLANLLPRRNVARWAMLLVLASGGSANAACDPDNGGLTLPQGFCATVFADEVGRARRVVAAPNGIVYVANMARTGDGIIALHDTDGDGRADRRGGFAPAGGGGLGVFGQWLYYGLDDRILRYRLPARGQLEPAQAAQVVVRGFPQQRSHATKTFSFDGDGHLYVNVGAPSNACQREARRPGVAGLDPCPQLERQAGIWRFDAARLEQTQRGDGERYATGIRNAVANAWDPRTDKLYVVQHGRDQLAELWPEHFTDEQRAELPAEELFAVDANDDFGWPYCYYDPMVKAKRLSPEYGGDGDTLGRCERAEKPVVAFPAHWAPNDIVFYGADHFPAAYRHGAFIAFHGSWNRQPFSQEGFRVAFVPADEAGLSGRFEDFATGFVGSERITSPGQARHRPAGLAIDSAGALYIADSTAGRIWRVTYQGSERTAATAEEH